MHPVTERTKKHIPKPPDGGWGWIVVFASFMVHVIADGVAYTFGLFFVKISDEFGNKAQTSMIASIMGGITYCIGPLAGALVNKYGCRPVAIVGSVIATIGFGISFWAQSNTYLILSIGVLGGIGLGLIYLPAIVSVTCYFEKRRAFATGIAVCGSGFGTFLMAPFMEFLIDSYGWRGALLATAGLILNCVIFSALFRPLPDETPAAPDEEKSVPTIVEPGTDDEPVFIFEPHADAAESDDLLFNLSPAIESQPDVVKDTNQSGAKPVKPKSISIRNGTPSFLTTNTNKDTLVTSVSHPVLPVGLVEHTDSLPRFSKHKQKRHSLKFGSDVIFESSPHSPVRMRSEMHSSVGIISSRKDIFYSGSIANIPELHGESSETFADKVARSPEDSADLEFSKKICGIPCSPEIHQVFKTMMDVSILKNPVFLIFALSNFLTSIGYSCPYIFLKDKAIADKLIDDHSASWLIGIIGISNTLSRILLGYFSDKPWVNRLYLYNIALMLCGLSTGLAGHTNDLQWLRVYAVTFGVTVGVFVSLTSVILVDLLGLDKLTNAFGFLLLAQGIATLMGPPMIGALYDHYQDYRSGFWLAGGFILISGAMLFIIPCLQRRYPLERKSMKIGDGTKKSELRTNNSKSIMYDQLNGDGFRKPHKITSNNNLATV